MYVSVLVDPKDAVRRGLAVSGYHRVNVTQEQLSALTPEQREWLATSDSLDSVTSYNQSSPPSIRVPAQTWEAVVEWCDAQIARRQNQIATAELAFAEFQAECEKNFTERKTIGGAPNWPWIASEKWRSWFNEFVDRPQVANWVTSLNVQSELAKSASDAASDRLVAETKAVKDAAAQEKAEAEARSTVARDELIRQIGTDNQIARLDEGLLPNEEAWGLVRDHMFESLDCVCGGHCFARFERLTKDDISCNVCDEYTDPDPGFLVNDAVALTAEQWDRFSAIKESAPEGATVTPRRHSGWCDRHNTYEGEVERYSALVALDWHGKKLSREYAL